MQTVPRIFPLALTVVFSALSVTLTLSLSVSVSFIYGAVFAFVTFVAPALLVWAQRFKK